MTDYAITLTLPARLFERAQQIAETTAQPIEQVLVEQLENALDNPFAALPRDEQVELEALTLLSDATLWTIAREQMDAPTQARLQTLMDKNSRVPLSDTEAAEFDILVEQGQKLMLRKAQAAALLVKRGHTVTPDDLDE
ncbi:MAG: hypothetical protein K8L91_09965 [Anaerolineae bacterium]|nr:hypothetical protein [Anaerolineae bacterium]